MFTRAAIPELPWEIVSGRDYQTADVTQKLVRAFYLRLPPGGRLHRHRDTGDVTTYHVVLETNPLAVNWWIDSEGRERSVHLEPGCYLADRTVEHWAVNDGPTPRTHLLLEFSK